MKKYQWIVAIALSGAMVAPTALAGERGTRNGKVDEVSFRLASYAAESGFEAQALPNGRTVYVSPEEAFRVNEVANLATSPSDDGQLMTISLRPGVAEQLALRTTQIGADAVAIVRSGRLMSAGTISSIGIDATTITGMSGAETTRLQRLIASRGLADAGTVVTVVPQQATAAPGDSVTVDVYVSNVEALRTYQFALDVSAGAFGSLTRDYGVVDVAHADYVFGGGEVIQAVDEVNGRFGAVMIYGGADAPTRRYLGSYTYQVSPDASGTFRISVREGTISFLNSVAGANLPFRAVPGIITIG